MIREYDIILHSLLGKRYGKMQVNIQGHELSGFFKVLRREQSFTGIMDEYGTCIIDGTLLSLKKQQKYHGEGVMDAENVRLTLQLGPAHLSLSGTVSEGGNIADGQG